MCGVLPCRVDISALLDLMLAPGLRRLQLWKHKALHSTEKLKQFTSKFILALCQSYEMSEGVETDVQSDFLFVVEFNGEIGNGDMSPWNEVFGPRTSRTAELIYPAGIGELNLVDLNEEENREWTVFEWDNCKTGRVMNLMINVEHEDEIRHPVAFYLRFKVDVEDRLPGN